METLGEISNEETVFYFEKKGNGAKKKDIEKMHRVLNHKGVRNMEFAFRNAGRLDAQISKMIKEAVESCNICQKRVDQDQNHGSNTQSNRFFFYSNFGFEENGQEVYIMDGGCFFKDVGRSSVERVEGRHNIKEIRDGMVP